MWVQVSVFIKCAFLSGGYFDNLLCGVQSSKLTSHSLLMSSAPWPGPSAK